MHIPSKSRGFAPSTPNLPRPLQSQQLSPGHGINQCILCAPRARSDKHNSGIHCVDPPRLCLSALRARCPLYAPIDPDAGASTSSPFLVSYLPLYLHPSSFFHLSQHLPENRHVFMPRRFLSLYYSRQRSSRRLVLRPKRGAVTVECNGERVSSRLRKIGVD